MVKIRAFTGHLGNDQHLSQILSPPYDVLNTEEARKMAEGNPLSFLHCNKPEIDLPADLDPYDMKVYEGGRDTLLEFIAKGYIVKDTEKTMYVYQQTMAHHTQKALVGLASNKDYEENKIKKHEFTLAKKEADRTKLIDIQNASLEPVFLTFKDNQEPIKAKIEEVSTRACYGDVTTDDGVRHVLWRCTPVEAEWFVSEFEKIPNLYVADGHHRTAAAFNVGKLRAQRAKDAGQEVTGEEPFNFFLTLFYPADNLWVLDYNRVLKTLNDMTSEEFINKLKVNFDITEMPEGADTKPAGIHKFSLLIDNKWHYMNLKESSLDKSTPLSQLDSNLLNELVFSPICGITDLKNDSRIDFVGGIRGHKELERRCKIDCKVAIAMFPCSMAEVMDVADAGMIMPPKSTWFEPKPRSGLIMRVFEE